MTKMVSECSKKGEIDHARKLFDEMPKRDTVTWNIMIRCYIENDRIIEARELFDKMDEKSTVSWNSMVMAYTQERRLHIALKLFLAMPYKDVVSWTSIVTGFCRDSQIMDGYRLFMQMPVRNSVSWSSIISGFQQNGLGVETLCLFREMLCEGVVPTSHCFTSAFTACGELAVLSVGQQLYSQIVKRGFEDNVRVGNSVITMFMKSGSFDNARRVFIRVPLRNLVTWNSMIVGYGQHGYGMEAILVFHQMQKARFLPDDISFVGVIQGCTHCGFVEEAMKYFRSMQIDCGISPGPEHYACLVDVLARAGFLKEASEMIASMPFVPGPIFWRTLLNGCRIWGDLKLGVFAADWVLRMEPYNASAHLMVIDMYTTAGRLMEVFELRRLMKERGIRKDIAYSWVEFEKDAKAMGLSWDEYQLQCVVEQSLQRVRSMAQFMDVPGYFLFVISGMYWETNTTPYCMNYETWDPLYLHSQSSELKQQQGLDIASDGCFSLEMVARLQRSLQDNNVWMDPHNSGKQKFLVKCHTSRLMQLVSVQVATSIMQLRFFICYNLDYYNVRGGTWAMRTRVQKSLRFHSKESGFRQPYNDFTSLFRP
ncbi:hypothetical protein IFM89_008500 [Coptis chinensis]|uniref:Pentatricopeptide repeat-containing protein n=1 Tax=Coptis chinensis TaxID=261450 RepID=A0A835HBZ4_9MAGN|nr:hypothetical protein IFM89_008500 [Coptis chinensis]